MPIVFELMVLMLVAYGAGLALGWAIWGRAARIGAGHERDDADKGETEE